MQRIQDMFINMEEVAEDAYKNTDKIIVKFVPASGAASRMFKNSVRVSVRRV